MTARLRVTVLVRNVQGLPAKIEARTRRQKAAVLEASGRDAERTFARAQDECPRQTHYMALHMLLERTRNGYNWALGFRAQDFVGQVNPTTGRAILAFYPFFVIHGTSRMAGNNFLRRAFLAEQENRRAGYRRAVVAA